MHAKTISLPKLALAAILGTISACTPTNNASRVAQTTHQHAQPSIPLPTLDASKPLDYPGIHNAVAYHDGFISGSVPEGDAGFRTLAGMGIKTIISVDGAVPEVEKANALGMRYIHLPIGYNGFDEDRKLQLVRATRDAMATGPVYIHCHHGKHRSGGAAAAVAASLGWQTPEFGVDRMKVSGTAPNYKGLYAVAGNATLLNVSTINAVPANFPAIAKPSGFVQGMVEIDAAYDHLKAIEKAGWITPTDHPDLVPVAEAGRLADLYRTLGESDYTKRKPSDFARLLTRSNEEAQKLEDLLAAPGPKDPAALSAQFKLIAASCKECHVKYRD